MQEHVGFVLGNIRRKSVLDALDKRGDMSRDELSKSLRIPRRMLDGIIDELKSHELVEEKGEILSLTEKGKEILKKATSIGAVG